MGKLNPSCPTVSAGCSLYCCLLHVHWSLAGSAAIQIAKVIGAKVFVTASSAEKLAFCKDLGADVLINYREQDFAEIVKKEANPDAMLQVGCCRCATAGCLCRTHEVSCVTEPLSLQAAQTAPTCLM